VTPLKKAQGLQATVAAAPIPPTRWLRRIYMPVLGKGRSYRPSSTALLKGKKQPRQPWPEPP